MEFSQAQVLAVIGVLCTVISVLWSLVMVWWRKEKKRLAECEAKHEENEKTILDLTGKYKYLEGRMDGVEKLSNSVLARIDARRERVHHLD